MCNEWASIETAPKDGTRVLALWVWSERGKVGGGYTHEVVAWDGRWWRFSNGESVSEPSHWQPLPEPPETV